MAADTTKDGLVSFEAILCRSLLCIITIVIVILNIIIEIELWLFWFLRLEFLVLSNSLLIVDTTVSGRFVDELAACRPLIAS